MVAPGTGPGARRGDRGEPKPRPRPAGLSRCRGQPARERRHARIGRGRPRAVADRRARTARLPPPFRQGQSPRALPGMELHAVAWRDRSACRARGDRRLARPGRGVGALRPAAAGVPAPSRSARALPRHRGERGLAADRARHNARAGHARSAGRRTPRAAHRERRHRARRRRARAVRPGARDGGAPLPEPARSRGRWHRGSPDARGARCRRRAAHRSDAGEPRARPLGRAGPRRRLSDRGHRGFLGPPRPRRTARRGPRGWWSAARTAGHPCFAPRWNRSCSTRPGPCRRRSSGRTCCRSSRGTPTTSRATACRSWTRPAGQ